MKKPIDPNLDNILDELTDENTAPTSSSNKKVIDFGIDADGDDLINFSFEGTADAPEKREKHAEEKAFEIESKSDEASHVHHHHSTEGKHHYSSGEHHHSSSHSHHHSSHSHHHHKHKKRLSIPAKIGISAICIVLAVVIAFIGTLAYLDLSGKNELKNIDKQTDYQEVIEYNGSKYVYNQDVVAIAFLGVDKRELGLNDNAVGTGGQADADIVLTINTKTGKAKAIAVPRDTMVDIDLYSESGIFLRSENMQLCLSYAYGDGKAKSAENTTTSISRILYDVPISKYFALDLNGIKPINDAMGGVTVESLYDFPNLGIKKGDSVKLTGDLTETYVRQRDMDTVNASLNRTSRQVQYIKAFSAQVIPAVTQDFSVVSRLYETASKYSTTNLSLSNVTYLASLMLSKGITNFDTVTIEGEMKASDRKDYADFVYAEFYPDEDKLMQLVLDTFYTKQDK